MSQSDRGNYTCKPASGGEASIHLHVLEGEAAFSGSEQAELREAALEKKSKVVTMSRDGAGGWMHPVKSLWG